MKALLFVGTLGEGGAERQFAQLADGMAAAGHEVRLVSAFAGGPNWRRFAEENERGPEALWSSRDSRAIVRILQYALAPPRLATKIRAFGPDVVYSGLYLSNLIAWMAVRLTREDRLVWGIRSSNQELNWKRAVSFRVGALLSRTVPLAVANSEAGRQYHAESGFSPGRWEVVPNGIDTQRFALSHPGGEELRHRWGAGANIQLVGLVARIAPMKGHREFIEAASHLLERRDDVAFVCVGDGNSALRTRLQREVTNRLHPGASLRWAGAHDDMPAVYAALDVCVLASPHGEGFPNVVGEAMACGVSCVVTDVGDAAAIVGEHDRVVEPGDTLALAEGIESLLDDPAARTPAAALARRRRIQDRFSVEALVRRTVAALQSVSSESIEAGVAE